MLFLVCAFYQIILIQRNNKIIRASTCALFKFLRKMVTWKPVVSVELSLLFLFTEEKKKKKKMWNLKLTLQPHHQQMDCGNLVLYFGCWFLDIRLPLGPTVVPQKENRNDSLLLRCPLQIGFVLVLSEPSLPFVQEFSPVRPQRAKLKLKRKLLRVGIFHFDPLKGWQAPCTVRVAWAINLSRSLFSTSSSFIIHTIFHCSSTKDIASL